MDFDRNTSAGHLINHIARLFARHLEVGLRPHGLALGACPALLSLWEKDGRTQRIRLTDLARALRPLAIARVAETNSQLLAGLDDAEQQRLISLMRPFAVIPCQALNAICRYLTNIDNKTAPMRDRAISLSLPQSTPRSPGCPLARGECGPRRDN